MLQSPPCPLPSMGQPTLSPSHCSTVELLRWALPAAAAAAAVAKASSPGILVRQSVHDSMGGGGNRRTPHKHGRPTIFLIRPISQTVLRVLNLL